MWTMWDAPSDRDYYEQFNPSEPDDEPEGELPPAFEDLAAGERAADEEHDLPVLSQECFQDDHRHCRDVDANCCECSCHLDCGF